LGGVGAALAESGGEGVAGPRVQALCRQTTGQSSDRIFERHRNYVERRTKEGLSKKDIIRCLKRYIAREVYRAIRADLAKLSSQTPQTAT
jgi:hypothetical protein